MTTPTGYSMQTGHSQQDRVDYLTLSVEALWIARVVQDALDIALGSQPITDSPQDERLRALRLNRDVFERLGIYGCSPLRVSPWSPAWSATSRVELIRQVAVHWRAFIDTSFGTAISAQLIQSLTDEEVCLLDHIQRFSRTLQLNYAPIVHCVQQQMEAMLLSQESSRAKRRATYLGSALGR